jgi:hypothetical protein
VSYGDARGLSEAPGDTIDSSGDLWCGHCGVIRDWVGSVV